MATKIKLQNDIKKLKAAIKSKETPKSIVSKLEVQLEKAEKELEAISKSGKPDKKTSSSLSMNAKKRIEEAKKERKAQRISAKDSDVEKDGSRRAIKKTGRRISQGLRANKTGSKEDNKGNVYYEYRNNRYDKRPNSAPRLERGGMMTDEKYELKEDDYVWNASGNKLVVDKVTDDEYYLSGFMKPTNAWSKSKVHDYLKTGFWSLKPKMASGGMMDDGGVVQENYSPKGEFINQSIRDFLLKMGSSSLLKPAIKLLHEPEADIEKAKKFAKESWGVTLEDVLYIQDNYRKLRKIKNDPNGDRMILTIKPYGRKKISYKLVDEKTGNEYGFPPYSTIEKAENWAKEKGYETKRMDSDGMMAKGGKIAEKPLSYYTYSTPLVTIIWKGKPQPLGRFKSAEEAYKVIQNESSMYGNMSDYEIQTPDKIIKLGKDGIMASGGMMEHGGEPHKLESDGYMAKGGAVEHGLKKGDLIVDDMFWENSVVVKNDKEKTTAKVNLSNGKRVESKM